MEKLIVTGAGGLLGNKIVELAKEDYEVIPLSKTDPLRPGSMRLDITDQRRVSGLFSRLRPDITVHTASETDVDKCEVERSHAWRVNVEGTRNVARACDQACARLVYISTDYVFNGEKGNYKEEDQPDPITYYGITKLEGEKQVAQLCQDYAILRTSVLYGWHRWKQNFATWVISALRDNREICVVDDHFNTPTLADNLAEITLETMQRGLRGLYHASGSQRVSRMDFAVQIARTFDLNLNLIKPIKMNQLKAWTAKRPKDSSLNTEKIQAQLETRFLNINEGLSRMKECE